MKTDATTLSISKLSVVDPVLSGFSRLGLDPSQVYSRYFPHIVSAAASTADIPSQAIHEMMEGCAQETGNRLFGSQLSEVMGPEITQYFDLTSHDNGTLVEKLVGMQLAEAKMSGAIKIELLLESDGASIVVQARSFSPEKTAQTDAWGITTLYNVIASHMAPAWNPSEVSIFLHDRNTLPNKLTRSSAIESWDYSGFKISFPSEWLLFKHSAQLATDSEGVNKPELNFMAKFKAVLRPILSDPKLKLDKAADYCGLSPRELQSKLAGNGATFSEVVTELKREFAEEQLTSELMGIAAISEALGYSDVSAFSRAFKNWGGLSPEQFRKQQTNFTG